MASPKTQIDLIREAAESSLEKFIRLVVPKQVFGSVHIELCEWMTRQEAKQHQLILMPRDHQKSRFAAFWALWELTKDPCRRILYISSTSGLAEKQLGFIKDIMQSSIYRKYWPEMTNADEGKRKKWTNSEIMVDHPRRAEEGIRDPSILTAGLTTNIVGLHFDIAVMDDVVTGENAYTEEGRNAAKRRYSLLASIESADCREIIVGTRYHPKDLYSNIVEMNAEIFSEDGEVESTEAVYELFERQVEDAGDGSGTFLWPRQQRTDGIWFGFDKKILAVKKAKYVDQTQFRAQYYNDPNDSGSAGIGREYFQYYDPQQLRQQSGHWYYSGKRLNVIAAIDFSFSTTKRADFTTIAVVGCDSARNYYVLDLDRFKTSLIKEYYSHLMAMHLKWDFRKLIAETNVAQETIVRELKESYFKPNGLMITVEEVKPNRYTGTKDERIRATLEPRYQNMAVWHKRDGNCQTLEDELVMQFPPHDDCKDAVANAIDKLAAPTVSMNNTRIEENIELMGNTRFGGLG